MIQEQLASTPTKMGSDVIARSLAAPVGWWWADPVAALVMVPIIVKEGIEGLRGETCCDDD